MRHTAPDTKRRTIRLWTQYLLGVFAIPSPRAGSRHQGRTEGILELLVTGLVLGLERRQFQNALAPVPTPALIGGLRIARGDLTASSGRGEFPCSPRQRCRGSYSSPGTSLRP